MNDHNYQSYQTQMNKERWRGLTSEALRGIPFHLREDSFDYDSTSQTIDKRKFEAALEKQRELAIKARTQALIIEQADILGKNIVAFYRTIDEVSKFIDQNKTTESIMHVVLFILNTGSLALTAVDMGLSGAVTQAATMQVSLGSMTSDFVITKAVGKVVSVANQVGHQESPLGISHENKVKSNFLDMYNEKIKNTTSFGKIRSLMKWQNLPVVSSLITIAKHGKGAFNAITADKKDYYKVREFFAVTIDNTIKDHVNAFNQQYYDLLKIIHKNGFSKDLLIAETANSKIFFRHKERNINNLLEKLSKKTANFITKSKALGDKLNELEK